MYRVATLIIVMACCSAAWAERPALSERAKEAQRRADEAQARVERLEEMVHDEIKLLHEQYIADAPVRQQYYSALAESYRADAARSYERAAQWQTYPQVIYTVPLQVAPYRARSMYWDLHRGVLVRPGDPSWYRGW